MDKKKIESYFSDRLTLSNLCDMMTQLQSHKPIGKYRHLEIKANVMVAFLGYTQ